jgi:hypothetical protein
LQSKWPDKAVATWHVIYDEEASGSNAPALAAQITAPEAFFFYGPSYGRN